MMTLESPTDRHLQEMTGWFPDARSCEIWATREFRFPFTEATFRQDFRLDLPSWVLVDAGGALLGFGQYYLRAGRCHLYRRIGFVETPYPGKPPDIEACVYLCARLADLSG